MPVPTYDQFIDPLLKVLSDHPQGVKASEAFELAADRVGLTAADRQQILPSGLQHVYKNRIGWAHDRLKRAGYSSSPRKGFWQITNAGRPVSGEIRLNVVPGFRGANQLQIANRKSQIEDRTDDRSRDRYL